MTNKGIKLALATALISGFAVFFNKFAMSFWTRMFFGSIFLLIFLALSGNIIQLVKFNFTSLSWLLLSGFLLFGYVTTWYSALKHAPATTVSSVLVLAAPITAILNSVFITHKFNVGLLLPIALILFAVLIYTRLLNSLSSLIRRKMICKTTA